MYAAADGGNVWWLAPTYRMAGQVWRDLKRMVGSTYKATIDNEDMRVDIITGGSITIRSTSQPDRLRGAGLDYAILDEAAFMLPNVWGEVIRPMLADGEGRALFLSTPYGRNWFYDLYRLGLDGTQKEWCSYHFTSYDNPLIPAEEFDAIRLSTPEAVFRAEYMAEFVDDDGQVFRRIREAVMTSPADVTMGRIVGGIDWGRSHDYTVVVLMDADTRRMVAIERFHQIGWALQRGRVAELCAQWQPAFLFAEENSIGSVNIEALQAEGLPLRPFKMTASSKPPLIEALSLAIERGELGLLPDETLLGELAAYTQTRLVGGGTRYSAPAGMHDDCVIALALALAWHGVRYGGATGIDFA